MIDIQELAEQAVHVWLIDAIEEALGREAALVLPDRRGCGRAGSRYGCLVMSSRRCSVWPRRTARSAGALLTRELHGLVYAHRQRLGASIAGFAEAVNWPFPEDAPQG